VTLQQVENSMEFQHLSQQMQTFQAGQEVAGTTVDAANVIAQLGSIVDAIPSSLYGSEDLYSTFHKTLLVHT
jgi:hypothetical protein